MKRLMFVLILASSAAAGSPRLSGASAGLALMVSPPIAIAPADVVVRARVERHEANRGLEITADSESFFRSSFIQLDGDHAPTITEIRFRDLPGGTYQVSVALLGSDGVRGTVRRQLTVIAAVVE